MAAASSSHKVGTHDTHTHHQGGTPPSESRVFPSAYYHTDLTAMADERIEVKGFDGYMHVRCHASSPRACYCGRYSYHTDSMIVAIDGACPSNGTDKAVMSACGVYLGPGAKNWSWRVSDKPGERHTSSRAEIHAAIGALKAIMPFAAEGGQVVCEHSGPPCRARHIVIKSDSSYLVNSITQHVEKWRLNGWKTAKKTPVKNRDLWEELLGSLALVETTFDTRVDFWHVPREENVEADRLANEGLLSGRVLDHDKLELCDFRQSREVLLYPFGLQGGVHGGSSVSPPRPL